MINFKETLIRFLDQLKSNPFVELQKDYIGVPVYQDIYDQVLAFHKVELSKNLSDFYHIMSSCKIEWLCDLEKHTEIKKYVSEDAVINGNIYVRPVEDMLRFDKKLEADWWTRNLDETEKQDLRDFRYFDFNDDYIRVGFIIQDAKINEDEMYFIVQESTGFSPSGINFEQYLEKIILYKGFEGWQYNMYFPMTENNKRMQFYVDQIFNWNK
jgi:hypothetical protein